MGENIGPFDGQGEMSRSGQAFAAGGGKWRGAGHE